MRTSTLSQLSRHWPWAGAIGCAAAVLALQSALPAKQARFSGASASQPLALSADGDLLAVANPDNDSVSFFDTSRATPRQIAEVPVGREPNGVALSPDGREAYVANTVDGTVSVIKITGNGKNIKVHKVVRVGTEPYGVAITPDGRKVYVTNGRSNSVSVINARNNHVVDTIENVGIEPRGLAITGDDDDEIVYVTQFLSLPVAGKIDGADDAKVGYVTRISAESDTIIDQIQLAPIADTGFKALGDALARVPPGTVSFTTGAYPNQLNNIAIKNGFAYVPNTGASPNGPLRFNVNTQSLLSVINRGTGLEVRPAINMHLAVAQQANTAGRFITQPWAMAFKHASNEGYVVSAASNIVVKVAVDPATVAQALVWEERLFAAVEKFGLRGKTS